MKRRSFLHLASAAAFLLAAGPSWAETYPSKPVKIVVGLAAGGATDIAARLLAQGLTERFKQQFIVENRPGAGSMIAAELVSRAPADGYTFFMATGSYATAAALEKAPRFDPVQSFTPVLQLTAVPFCIAVNPSLGVSSLKDLTALAKQSPGKLKYASTGTAGQAHFSGELFKSLTGTDLVHVPYKGAAPAITDVINGQVPVIFTDLFSVLSRVRSGELKVISVLGSKRAQAAPDIPTTEEQGVAGFKIIGWSGLFAPAGTSGEIVDVIQRAVAEIAAGEAFKKQMADHGAELVVSKPGEFAGFFKSEVDTYRKIADTAGIKPE